MKLNLLKLFATAAIASSMTACGVIDDLASNEQVSNADNNQVITIGDSIWALSGELQDNLEAKAGETFRRYTLSGAQLVEDFVTTSIKGQYETAKSHDANIKTVLMDGAGNDILIPAIAGDVLHNCKTQWYQFGHLSSRCKNQINDLYVDAVNFLNEMDNDGVENVVYLGYYYTKNGLFLLDSMEEAIDYGDLKLSQACANSTANCTFVDPRAVINDSDIIIDGIHPSASGSEKLANLMWPVVAPVL